MSRSLAYLFFQQVFWEHRDLNSRISLEKKKKNWIKFWGTRNFLSEILTWSCIWQYGKFYKQIEKKKVGPILKSSGANLREFKHFDDARRDAKISLKVFFVFGSPRISNANLVSRIMRGESSQDFSRSIVHHLYSPLSNTMSAACIRFQNLALIILYFIISISTIPTLQTDFKV